MIVHIMTHERSTLVNSEKYIGSKFIKHDLRSGDGSQREVADGVQLGNGKRQPTWNSSSDFAELFLSPAKEEVGLPGL